MAPSCSTPAWRIGASQRTDASAQTIGRWTKKAAAALVADSRETYKLRGECLHNARCEDAQWNWAGHSVATDGTNKK